MTESLLAALTMRSNHRGIVLASEQALARETTIEPARLRTAIRELAAAGKLSVLAPLPFLVCKLLSWSGRDHAPNASAPAELGLRSASHIEVPVSSAAAAAKQQHEDGGAGEGGALLDRVLAVLGPEANPAEFRSLLAYRDPSLVLRCLRRVEATRTIRVSRAALFRSLLSRLQSMTTSHR